VATDDETLVRQARSLFDRGRLEEAAAHYRRLVDARPDDPSLHFGLARTLHEADRLTAATRSYRAALARDDGLAAAWVNLGQALTDQGEADGAEGCFARAEEIGGRDRTGAATIADAVSRARRAATPPAGTEGVPPWRGEALAAHRLLIFSNHGVGDAIERVRHVPMTAQRGADPVLVCPPELVTLFQASELASTIRGSGEAPPACDRVVALSALPHVLYGDGDPPAPEVPYLVADPAKTRDWRHRHLAGDGMAVGLVWAGNRAHVRDRARSLPFAFLDAILSLPGIRFYSLQTGPRAEEALDHPSCNPLTPHLMDFSDTAAAVSALDLVISVDTAVAHLAGALARPVWVLLGHHADSRWTGSADHPTPYPTARLFRQRRAGEWGPLIDQVATTLTDLAANRGGL
jgi:hypothetical protein